jgi:threonine aldolase
MENTHNRGGGNAVRPSEMSEMARVAREHGLSIHLDGARIFNAAVALGTDVKDLAQHADSVMFCLSKGLSAPVGSIIVGSHGVIARARRMRKIVGGDLRQSGVLAAAGIVALESMVGRLAEDHRNAGLLARLLGEIPDVILDLAPVPTNMVFLDTKGLGIDAAKFVEMMRSRNILCGAQGPTRVRMVTHRHITSDHIAQAADAVQHIVRTR